MAKELIHAKMVEIMKAVGVIEKNRKGHGYKYRGVYDALAAIQPAIIESGVHLSTEVLKSETMHFREPKPGSTKGEERNIFTATVTLRVKFVAEDGSFSIAEAAGEGQDQMGGDKASSKAMSAAFKYAIFLGLSIPSDSIVDNDEEADGDGGVAAGPVAPLALPGSAPTVAPVAPVTPVAPVAAATVTTPVTAPTSKLNGAQEEFILRNSDPVPQHLIDEIFRLANRAELNADTIQKSIEKRGAKMMGELTAGQALEMIANINGIITKKEADTAFQPAATGAA